MTENFKEHNREVKILWEDFYAGTPERIPMTIGVNPRFWLLDPNYNTKGITFKDYFGDPEIMWNVQLRFAKLAAFEIFFDHEMGVPENGWAVNVDFQNTFEAPWLGCEIHYPEDNVPATVPYLHEDNKYELLEKGVPDPFSGLMRTAKEYYEIFREKGEKGFVYEGAPVSVNRVMDGTDGPFTIACNLRGTEEFCVDLYEDTEYALQLMGLITEATIQRIKAWRKFEGLPEKSAGIWFADDSTALLSLECYKEFVLPFHKKLVSELSTQDTGNQIHLCGDASHLFKTYQDELGCTKFDTGFPVNHGELVKELGPEAVVYGGPRIQLLQNGTKEAVAAEVKRIIRQVKPLTKKFVLRDANNLAPLTPLENVKAMYAAVREYGRFE